MDIPDEAVNRAGGVLWHGLPGVSLDQTRYLTRQMLEAAAPILAEARGEAITIVCTAHRRRVKPGTGDLLVHVGGNVDRYCSSERFTIRLEHVADRGTAQAMLASLEDGSAPAGTTREDQRHG